MLSSLLSISVCCRASSSIAPFDFLKKWTLDWKGLVAWLWTARWILRMVITGRLTQSRTNKDPWLATGLPISGPRFFQTLLSLLFQPHLVVCKKFRPAPSTRIQFSYPILKLMRDPLEVTWSLLPRFLCSENDPYSAFKSCGLSVVCFA